MSLVGPADPGRTPEQLTEQIEYLLGINEVGAPEYVANCRLELAGIFSHGRDIRRALNNLLARIEEDLYSE